jgi:membrane associated rhomboid family serine protease
MIAWLLIGRRLRLSGPLAPKRESLGKQEYFTRRSLRMLLAFDFLLAFPAGALAIALGLAAGDWSLVGPVLVPALVLFGLPVAYLVRQVRADDGRRRAGVPPMTQAEVLAEARSVGHPEVDALLAGRPPLVSTVIAVIVITSVLSWVLPDAALVDRLAKVNQAILAGEIWRLLTVALVHLNLLHLAGNMAVLSQVGGPLERLAGARSLLLVLVLGTAGGTTASVAFLPGPSVGASGGVFAVAGALVAFGWRHRRLLPAGVQKKIIRSAATTLVFNLAITFALPFVDWAAHLGGLVSGLAIGAALTPSLNLRRALGLRSPSGVDLQKVGTPAA